MGRRCAPIQGDLQVVGVIWKGRRWRFEGRRRLAGLQVGCTLHTVVVVHLKHGVVHLIKHGGVVHLKHRCGSP